MMHGVLRSQREVIRDVDVGRDGLRHTWLTLGELRGLTRYGEASISAQLRHLRKLEKRWIRRLQAAARRHGDCGRMGRMAAAIACGNIGSCAVYGLDRARHRRRTAGISQV